MAETRQHSGVGPTGQRAGANIRQWRGVRNWTTARLAEEVASHGIPMMASTVTKIEKGLRRVTVDELVAFALALVVSPVTLLLPPEEPEGAPDDARRGWIPITDRVSVPWETAWRWMHGQFPPEDVSPREVRRFRRENKPQEEDPAREAYWVLRGHLEGAWRLELDGEDDGTMVAKLIRRLDAEPEGEGEDG